MGGEHLTGPLARGRSCLPVLLPRLPPEQPPPSLRLLRVPHVTQMLPGVPVSLLVLAGRDTGDAVTLALERPGEVAGAAVSPSEHRRRIRRLPRGRRLVLLESREGASTRTGAATAVVSASFCRPATCVRFNATRNGTCCVLGYRRSKQVEGEGLFSLGEISGTTTR